MQVFFVNRYFAPDESATSQLLSDLAFSLAEAGHTIHVVASRQLYEHPGTRLAAHEVLSGVTVHRVWTSRFGRDRLIGRAVDYLTFYLGASWALCRLARRGDVIVAKTDPPLLSVLGAVIAKIRGAVLVNWLQDVFPEVALALVDTPILRRLAGSLRGIRNASLRAAAVNVALGSRMAAHLRSEGVADAQIEVIHNWADGAALAPVPPDQNPLRRAWGLDGQFVVGYSGNMGRAHEFATVLGAAQALSQDPAIVFLMIGGGHRKAWLQREVLSRALTNVRFKPYQPRELLRNSLGAPDVHLISLQPALEGLIVPSKFYGSAAVGRPIIFIGDPQGDVAAMVEAAQCGVAVAVGDVDGLTEQIRRLSRSRDVCDAWGRNARVALLGRYDKSIALSHWRDTLAKAAASTARPTR